MTYIGVTGFTDREQVRVALTSIPTDLERPVMIGVLASQKTIQGVPAGNPKRYPPRDAISSVFIMDWRTINLVHYNTSDQTELAAQLWAAMEYGGPACDGLQLNIVWPNPEGIRGLRRSWPGAVLTLQISRGAMAACQYSAERVAERVSREYGSLIDYVLVDASGGRGVPLVPHDAAAYLIALSEARESSGQHFSLVVAGGLCAENIEHLACPVQMLVPELGIDAEGALRADDLLDDGKVSRYLRTAYAVL